MRFTSAGVEMDRTIALAGVAEALYGREFITLTRHGAEGLCRDRRSAAFIGGFHSRLGGLVVARRAARGQLFCPYEFTLFVNPDGALPVDEVVEALGDDFPR